MQNVCGKKEDSLLSVALSLVLVVFFLFMNAFFVVAEFALVRVRKSQLQIAEEEGKSGAKAALLVANNVNAYLSACQLGITLASLALGWLGEPAVSELIHPALEVFDLPESAVSAIAIALGFAIITALQAHITDNVALQFYHQWRDEAAGARYRQ